MTCYPFLERYITISISRSLKKRERERETGPSQLSQRLLGLLLGTEKKIGQKLIGAEQITASVPYSFLKWRIPRLFLLFLPFRRQERRPGNEDGSLDRWYKTTMLLGRKKHTGTEKQKSSYHWKWLFFNVPLVGYIYILTKAWNTTAKTVNDQCSSTLDQTRSWSVEKDKNRIKVKKDYCKDWSNNVKKAEAYNISSWSGLKV